MMAAFGGWLILGPAGLIKSITAIPRKLNVAAGAVRKSPDLTIEVELSKMLPVPFFPARKLYVKPEELSKPTNLAFLPPPSKKLSAEAIRNMRIQEEREKKQRLEYEQSHIMSAPFRHASMAFFNLFKAIGRTWSREGFVKLNVKEKTYKLDVSGGWALDGGRALDRLATLKPKL